MDEDVGNAVQRSGPHFKKDVRIVVLQDLPDAAFQVSEELFGVVVLAIHVEIN